MKYSITCITLLFTSTLCFAQTERVEEVAPGDMVFTVVEIQPEFPGGLTALNDYLSSNLKYPKKEKKKGIEGTSYLQFKVNKDGTLSDISIIKGLSPACDAEAVRLIKNSPPWKPGKQNGKVMTTNFVLPVKFALDKK